MQHGALITSLWIGTAGYLVATPLEQTRSACDLAVASRSCSLQVLILFPKSLLFPAIIPADLFCGCLQAAASAAAATVLRNHAASPSTLADISLELPDQNPQQVLTDCVHALCQWRDDVARQEDEGLQPSRLMVLFALICMALPCCASVLYCSVLKRLLCCAVLCCAVLCCAVQPCST